MKHAAIKFASRRGRSCLSAGLNGLTFWRYIRPPVDKTGEMPLRSF
jgi:hypothetical protein